MTSEHIKIGHSYIQDTVRNEFTMVRTVLNINESGIIHYKYNFLNNAGQNLVADALPVFANSLFRIDITAELAFNKQLEEILK